MKYALLVLIISFFLAGCAGLVDKNKIATELEIYEGGGKIMLLGGPLLADAANAEMLSRLKLRCPNGHKIVKRGVMPHTYAVSVSNYNSTSMHPYIDYSCL